MAASTTLVAPQQKSCCNSEEMLREQYLHVHQAALSPHLTSSNAPQRMAARANLRLRLWVCFGLAAAIRRGPDSQNCCAAIKIRTLHCRKAAVSLFC